MTTESRTRCIEQLTKLARGIAEAHGAEAQVETFVGYPPTVNDAGETDFLEAVARDALGAEKVSRMPVPTLGGEDFSYYLERVPGSFFFLGVGDGRPGGYPSLHHPAYDFNDGALSAGMKVFVHAALAFGERDAPSGAP